MFAKLKEIINKILSLSKQLDNYKKDSVVEGMPSLAYVNRAKKCIARNEFEKAEKILEEAMELLGEDIAMIHIKDFVIRDGKMDSVAAGTGLMNYDRIMKFIKERKPYVHVTLENTVPENAVQARKFIQEIWERS